MQKKDRTRGLRILGALIVIIFTVILFLITSLVQGLLIIPNWAVKKGVRYSLGLLAWAKEFSNARNPKTI
jgi:hypothetical protein